jgi:hypothetical protein
MGGLQHASETDIPTHWCRAGHRRNHTSANLPMAPIDVSKVTAGDTTGDDQSFSVVIAVGAR